MPYQIKVDVEHPQLEPEENTEVICDIYDTEINEGDKYYINEHGELIHGKNLVRYLIEDNLVKEYTR